MSAPTMPPSTPTSPFPVPWPVGPTFTEPTLFDLAPVRDTTADCCPAGQDGHDGDCPGWPPYITDHPACCDCTPAVCAVDPDGEHCDLMGCEWCVHGCQAYDDESCCRNGGRTW